MCNGYANGGALLKGRIDNSLTGLVSKVVQKKATERFTFEKLIWSSWRQSSNTLWLTFSICFGRDVVI